MDKPALGGRGEQHHGDHRDHKDEHRLQGRDIDQQQFGVEDEQERQQGRADVVGKSLQAGPDGIAAGNRGRSKGGEAHRRRVVGKNAEIEHEQVHRDQRDDQPVGRTQGEDDRRHQGGHHDIVRRGGQSHPQDQAHHRHQDQHQDQAAPGQQFDEFPDDLVGAGQRDGADDDARGTGGDADADHVAGAGDHAVNPFTRAPAERLPHLPRAPHQGLDGMLGQCHHDHGDGGPECRQSRREAFDDDAPDQDDDGQDVVEPGDGGGADPGQFVEARFHRQVGLARCEPQKDQIEQGAEYRDHGKGRIRRHLLDPSHAEIDEHSQQGDADEPAQKPDDLGGEGQRGGRLAESLEVEFHRLQMHDVDQCDIGHQCRHQRVLDDFRIGDAGKFGDEERGGTHDRRCELAVGGGSHFHGTRLLRGEPGLLHQRNRERPRGDGVGDGRTRIQAAERRRHHRRLRRAAAQVSQQGKGDLDEEVARAGLLEDRAEEDEQEDQGGRYPEGHPEDPFALHPVVPHGLAVGGAFPADGVRQHFRVAEEDVQDEHGGHDQQGKAQCPVNRDSQHQHADGRHHQVPGGGQPRPQRDLVAEYHDVEAGHDPKCGDHPVVPGNGMPGTGLEQRKGQGSQQQREGKVHQSGVGVGHHQADAGPFGEQEWQVGCDVQLEYRPGEGDHRNQVALPADRVARSRIHGRGQFVGALGLLLFRHGRSQGLNVDLFPAEGENPWQGNKGGVHKKGRPEPPFLRARSTSSPAPCSIWPLRHAAGRRGNPRSSPTPSGWRTRDAVS